MGPTGKRGGMGVGVSGPGSLHCAVLPLVVYRSSGVNMVTTRQLDTLLQGIELPARYTGPEEQGSVR